VLSDTEFRDEFRRIQQTVLHVENTLSDLDDVVRGNNRQGIAGMVHDMAEVRKFMERWNRREYFVRILSLAIGSNIVLTVLGLIVQLTLIQ
jgi:hypothetical protein